MYEDYLPEAGPPYVYMKAINATNHILLYDLLFKTSRRVWDGYIPANFFFLGTSDLSFSALGLHTNVCVGFP